MKTGAARQKAIAALMTCRTLKAAARKAGIGERTLRRWLQEEDFCKQLRQARLQAMERATNQLAGAMTAAVATLKKMLKSSKDAVAVRAAATLLDRAVKAAELLDVEGRLAELERIERERSAEGRKTCR